MAGQTEAILTRILEGIDRGELNPGDPIEERALIEAYGVSRTPLREAILRLEAIGLVDRPPRKGAILFEPTLEEFLAILEVHAKLERPQHHRSGEGGVGDQQGAVPLGDLGHSVDLRHAQQRVRHGAAGLYGGRVPSVGGERGVQRRQRPGLFGQSSQPGI